MRRTLNVIVARDEGRRGSSAMRRTLNPAVQLTVSFLLSLVVLVTHSWKLNLALALASLAMILLFRRQPWRHVGQLLLGLVFMTGVYFLTTYLHPNQSRIVESAGHTAFSVALEMGSRIFALGSVGISLCTSIEKNYFIASLIRQCKVPVPIAYSILVAINFLGLIRGEYEQAKLALRLRGFSGASVYLQALLTMLIRLIRQSEYTATAMEARGFSKRRLQKITPCIAAIDIVYICVIACYVCGVLLYAL
ncbi:hypothetical protein TAMA11512_24150 [Selenomonas sp. TAMA-11512]|uniref:energy-coupling factor transporter transmembrane component T family protein n=1 Tax=Selenomonas sp. TAMA-11512 TaxID=3095337 RepID=UPI00308FC285|nr:hypothetical protein TAMA11512_24150 [Selenomonas sp. TAMA-11512]